VIPGTGYIIPMPGFLARTLLHDSSSSSSSGDAGTLLTIKILAIFLIPVCTFVGALAPINAKWIRTSHTVLSYCNVLAGSIILGFGFLHVLPDAVADFDPFTDSVNGFPIIYALALLAFFCVLLVEKKLIIYMEKERKKLGLTTNNKIDVESSTELKTKDDGIKEDGHSHHHHHDHSHAFHSHDIVEGPSPYTSYMLTVGLAFHSIFEGLAIGLGDSVDGTILIFIGIGLHKFAEAFAMGMNFVRVGLPIKKSVILVTIFSSVCPLGVAIGLGLVGLSDTTHALVSSILNGFAVGVFMYIAILGMMLEEFAQENDLLKKVGLSLVGCIAMGCLSFLE